MFKIEELSGSLIKSGRFDDAIRVFFNELDKAHENGVISRDEMIRLQREFSYLLLRPDAAQAKKLGDAMLALSLRMPPVAEAVFEKNVKDSRRV
jgi:hypothetical protein